MRRREFLQSAGAAYLLGVSRWLQEQDEVRSPLETSPYLDSHVHVTSPKLTEFVQSKMPRNPVTGKSAFEAVDAKQLVDGLDAGGIRRAWVLSCAYLTSADVWPSEKTTEAEWEEVRAENDFTARQTSQHQDRLAAFAAINPKRPYAIEEIDRCVDEHGMVGLKLHCWNSLVDVRDEEQRRSLKAVLAHAAERSLPVVVHAFNGQVPGYGKRDVEIWAKELVLPLEDLRICFAHLCGAGGFYPPIEVAFEATVEILGPESSAAERVFVDLSATMIGKNDIGMPPTSAKQKTRMAELLDRWGCDRVLWGSDNMAGALDASRQHWPLGAKEWEIICQQTGDALLDS